ncbi:MAG: DUF1634 domain-containing protein [Gammaproteobacteria bacterium]
MIHIVRERRLLNIWIVRASVGLCMACMVDGLALFFLHGSRMPGMPAGSLWHILNGIVRDASSSQAGAFLDAGLLILLFTPIVRLLAGVYVSLRMRDWLYASIGLMVVALVVIGLLAGQNGG